MKLKNVLIVVSDLEKAKNFYKDLFGLAVLRDFESNLILMEGLVLQDKKVWQACINKPIIGEHNASVLYFEEANIGTFAEKLKRLYPETKYLTEPTTLSDGQKVMRFYDLDGNLIEVRTVTI